MLEFVLLFEILFMFLFSVMKNYLFLTKQLVRKSWKHLHISIAVFWKGKSGKGGLKSSQAEFPGKRSW